MLGQMNLKADNDRVVEWRSSKIDSCSVAQASEMTVDSVPLASEFEVQVLHPQDVPPEVESDEELVQVLSPILNMKPERSDDSKVTTVSENVNITGPLPSSQFAQTSHVVQISMDQDKLNQWKVETYDIEVIEEVGIEPDDVMLEMWNRVEPLPLTDGTRSSVSLVENQVSTYERRLRLSVIAF